MSEFKSYLSQLKFDPKLRDTWHAKWITNIRLVLLLVISVVAFGVFTALTLPRRVNPEVKIPIVTVVTVLPGASPSDMETLVTNPIEDVLTGSESLDTITSVSGNNVSVVTMQFQTIADGDKARADTQSLVDSVALSDNAQAPKVSLLDFENQPVWTFSLSGTGDTGSLMRFADRLKDSIEAIPEVKNVDISGFDTQEISVVVDPEKANEYGINPVLLSQSIKRLTGSAPAGSVDTDSLSFSLTIDPQVQTINDLRNLRVNVSGQEIKLGEIAQISEMPKPETPKSYIGTPQNKAKQSLTFYVYKTSSANIDATADKVEKHVNTEVEKRGDTFKVISITNSGTEIKEQYTDLFWDFVSTLALVFINLFLFLGLRQAALATLTTPLTFLAGFIFMGIFGLSINFISLFAFLLALGTSIDDTIVVISAMTTYNKTKRFTPEEAGLLVWRDFIVPICSTTITTVWAYAPLLLATGIIGEFIKSIPIVVSATMYSSTFFSVMVTLPLFIVILKPNIPRRVKIFAAAIILICLNVGAFLLLPKTPLIPLILVLINLLVLVIYRVKNKVVLPKKAQSVISDGVINLHPVENRYKNTILSILNSKHGIRNTLVIVGAFAALSYLLLPLGLVKGEFFPKSDVDTIFLNLEMPAGTNTDTVESHVIPLINDLRHIEESTSVIADVGRTQTGFGFAESASSALITINLEPKDERSVSSIDIAQNLREKYKNYPAGTITIAEQSGGPPAGADIQIKLLGDDLSVLNTYADKIELYLKSQRGVSDITKSVKPGTSKIVFTPDPDKLNAVGVTQDQVALLLRSYASGFTLDKLTLNDEKRDINFRYTSNASSPEELGSLSVATQTGPVPLLSLGVLELKSNPTQINHEDAKRTLSVSATVQPGFVVADINTKLEEYANTKLNLPTGYVWKTGGVNEENNESVQSIFKAMLLSFILILITMVVQFKSYRQAGIILLLIPFAISGVFIVFGLTSTPLSFPALIGVMALFGIVVTNAMFIVDKINVNLKTGMDLKNAIADAGESRLEPILLTSLTTILGLIPITISNPLWRGLGGAIISGLTFSGLIMLFFVPVAYYLLFKNESRAKA